jgi:hypothetical protein
LNVFWNGKLSNGQSYYAWCLDVTLQDLLALGEQYLAPNSYRPLEFLLWLKSLVEKHNEELKDAFPELDATSRDKLMNFDRSKDDKWQEPQSDVEAMDSELAYLQGLCVEERQREYDELVAPARTLTSAEGSLRVILWYVGTSRKSIGERFDTAMGLVPEKTPHSFSEKIIAAFCKIRPEICKAGEFEGSGISS